MIKLQRHITEIHDSIFKLDKEIPRRIDLWKRGKITAREEREFDQETLRWLEEARPLVFNWLIDKGSNYLIDLNETEEGRAKIDLRLYLLKAIDLYTKELRHDRRVMFQFPRLKDVLTR